MIERIKCLLLSCAFALAAFGNAAQLGGKQLYQTHCAACHGQTGEGGSGPTLATPRLVRAADEVSLTKIIKEGIAGTEMPSSRLDAAQIKLLAEFVQELGKLPLEKPAGDAARGAKLYAGKGGCTMCHAINGEGSSYGPDLSDIGLRRGAKHLLTSLLDPESDVAKSFLQFRPGTAITDNFLQVRLLTRAGKRINGVRVNEDSFTIHVRDASGQAHSFFKSELREFHKDWGKSSMPSYRKLTQTELDDLVAYLLTLRGER